MQLRRCTSIIILFLCSLVASCGESETAVVPTEGAAGQVRELRGTVTATRAGQKPRILTESDTIFVNDSLRTADDASVVILFAHNNARWQLGSGYKGKVVDSLAWRTKRHEASALVRTEHTQTAAAGRNSEREAAESIETLEIVPVAEMAETKSSASEPESPSDVPDQAAAQERESDKNTQRSAPSATSTRPPKYKPRSKPAPAAAPAPAPPPPARAPSPPPGAPSPVTAPLGESALGGSDDDAFTGAMGVGTTKADTSRHGHASGGDGSKTKRRQRPARATSKSRTLINGIGKTCSAKYKQKGSVSVSLTVTRSRISQLVVTGDSSLAATKKCIKQKLRATQHQGTFSDQVTITLQ